MLKDTMPDKAEYEKGNHGSDPAPQMAEVKELEKIRKWVIKTL